MGLCFGLYWRLSLPLRSLRLHWRYTALRCAWFNISIVLPSALHWRLCWTWHYIGTGAVAGSTSVLMKCLALHRRGAETGNSPALGCTWIFVYMCCVAPQWCANYPWYHIGICAGLGPYRHL
jgi:hypothetical protein